MSSKFPRPTPVKDSAPASPKYEVPEALASASSIASTVGGTMSYLKRRKAQRVKKIQQSIGTPGDHARMCLSVPHPVEWELALREISPVSEAHSFLIFLWKQPPLENDKGRWCLYEAIPEPLIEPGRLAELRSAPYWILPTPGERQAQAAVVSATQWEVYRERKLDVRPLWCLQGSEGGTPLTYTSLEERYLRLMGKPDRPPYLGDLPFTGWDNRVKRAVLVRDRLAKLGSVAALRHSGNAAVMKADQEAAEKEYRRVFWDTTAERMGPATELFAHLLKRGDMDGKWERQTAEDAAAAANAREHFIEYGSIPDALHYKRRRLVVAQS